MRGETSLICKAAVVGTTVLALLAPAISVADDLNNGTLPEPSSQTESGDNNSNESTEDQSQGFETPNVQEETPAAAPIWDAEYCKTHPCNSTDDTPGSSLNPDGSNQPEDSNLGSTDPRQKMLDRAQEINEAQNKAAEDMWAKLEGERTTDLAVMAQLDLAQMGQAQEKTEALKQQLAQQESFQAWIDDMTTNRTDPSTPTDVTCPQEIVRATSTGLFCAGGIALAGNYIFGTHGLEGATLGPAGVAGELIVTGALLTECAAWYWDLKNMANACRPTDSGGSSSGSSSNSGSDNSGSSGSSDNSDE